MSWFHARYWPASIMRVNCSVLLMMAFITYTLQDAKGETVTLQNDTVASGGTGAVQTGFQVGDIAASVFNLPAGVEAIRITKIETVWQVDPQYGGFHSILFAIFSCSVMVVPIRGLLPRPRSARACCPASIRWMCRVITG